MLAGLDIGTTGCKLTVYSREGVYLERIYREYPASRTASEHEADPAAIWRAVREALSEGAAKYPDIGGIGVSSFGESFVLLDRDDLPIRGAMLYTDPRGQLECDALCGRVGRKRLSHITGLNPHPMYSMPKLMWIRDNRPAQFEKAARVCLMEDYVIYMLTGEAVIDYSLSARTMAFDIRALDWSGEVFAAAGIDSGLFSRPVPTGTAVGTIKKGLSSQLGFKRDVLIVAAGHDQVAAAVGSGVFDEGMAVDGAGTTECITPVFTGIPDEARMAEGGYAIVPYVEPGKYVCYAFSYTGGALVKWFVDNLAGYAAAEAQERGVQIYEVLEGGDIKLPTGLLVLPHFAGAATPYMDYGAKGVIAGLTISSTQRDIFCGLMEGVCYEMLLNKNRLYEAGVRFGRLRATGGGANSRMWMQMKADILDMPVTALHSAEAGATGSCMMAGVATGLYGDIREAANRMVRERETYLPDPGKRGRYLELYERYEKLYDAVRPLV